MTVKSGFKAWFLCLRPRLEEITYEAEITH